MGLSVLIGLNLPLSTPLPRHSAHSADSKRDRFLHHRGLLSGGLIDHCIHRWCLLAIESRRWLHSFLFMSSFGALWGCLPVGLHTIWGGSYRPYRLSGVTLAGVNSSRRRRALVPDAVRLVSVRCGGLDWTCRQRARGADHQMFSWLHLQAAFKTSASQQVNMGEAEREPADTDLLNELLTLYKNEKWWDELERVHERCYVCVLCVCVCVCVCVCARARACWPMSFLHIRFLPCFRCLYSEYRLRYNVFNWL